MIISGTPEELEAQIEASINGLPVGEYDIELFPCDRQQFYEEMFENTLNDREGGLYVFLSLLMYTSGYFKKGRKSNGLGGLINEKRDIIPLHCLAPNGWSSRKAYVFLFALLRRLGIKPTVLFHKEIYLRYYGMSHVGNDDQRFLRFYENGETNLLFEDDFFWTIPEGILEFVELKNDFDSDENIQKIMNCVDNCIDGFVDGTISQKYGLLPFEKQRNLIVNKLSDFHSLIGNTFTISESHFKQYERISFPFMVALLWRLEYIGIWQLHALDDSELVDDKNSPRHLLPIENLNFFVYVTHKAQSLFEGLFKLKNLILDKVFDEDYKQLKIIRKKNEIGRIEGQIEVIGEDAKLTELRKKYPHSEITAVNYEGKTMKYKIVEKIRLKSDCPSDSKEI